MAKNYYPFFSNHAQIRIEERIAEYNFKYDASLTFKKIKYAIVGFLRPMKEYIETNTNYKIFNDDYMIEFVACDSGEGKERIRTIITVIIEGTSKNKLSRQKKGITMGWGKKTASINVSNKMYKRNKKLLKETDNCMI